MTEDFYIVAIVALLPMTAVMLILQTNPYHALVIRGILGAVAALVYALFGAADVALTEALVGTMLSITLYAVAVRSSLIMRVGVLENEAPSVKAWERADGSGPIPTIPDPSPTERLYGALRKILNKHYMRLELVPFANLQAMQTALTEKDIHTTCVAAEEGIAATSSRSSSDEGEPSHHLQTRIQRLYAIMQSELPPMAATLTYLTPTSLNPSVPDQAGNSKPDPVEIQA